MDILLTIIKTSGLALGYMAGVVIIKKYIFEPIIKRVVDEKYYKTIQGLFTFTFQMILYFVIRKYAFHFSFLSEWAGLYLLIGIAVGSVMILLSMVILNALKVYEYKQNIEFSDNAISNLAKTAVFFMVLALFEEIMIRGILYTGFRSVMGFFATIIVTTLIFVIPHLKNKGINIFSVTSLILAGVILNLLREYSGDIWMPFGFHFAWNFFQGIIGYNVSGDNEMIAIYKVTAGGKCYLDGGRFGIEASVITIGIIMTGILLLIVFMYL